VTAHEMIAAPVGASLRGEGWPSSSEAAIQVKDLRKKYGEIEAVRGISFEVRKGEIFGLIGPDGAGKTSTFQILAGVMEATSGAAEVLGRPARQMRSQSGYLTQGFTLYPDLSVAENIRYVGVMRDIDPREIERRSRPYLEKFDMLRFEDRLAGRLSGGMKQKLALVCALVPAPGVLLLDEPTTGVDPVSRREFWDALAHLAADGLTILVATPYLDEAERCHRVALMHSGNIQQIATPADLRSSLKLARLELFTPRLAEAERLLSQDAGDGLIEDVQRFGDRLDLLVHEPEKATAVLRERMASGGIDVAEIRTDTPTLENVFVSTLRKLGEEIHAVPFPHRQDHQRLHGQVAIGAKGLTKQFGDFAAVRNVNVEIKYGEIYGLLGANGAGKTTTIKMLCGLLEPSQGEMTLAGQAGGFRSREVRQRIGYMSQRFSLYDDLTIAENLDFFSSAYGVPRQDQPEKVRWILSFSGLDGKQDQMTGSLPGGWKQRVAFGSAIMHEPSVLFLDEPTSGVDPLARRAFWSMINELADRGTAVLVTTHYLEEAEQCNRLGLMVAGELVAEGSPAEIKAAQNGHLLEYLVDQPQRAADGLRIDGERWRVALFGDRLHVVTDEDARAGEQTTTAKLDALGIRVLQVREARFSLEDVFIGIVEKARLEGKVGAED
jgi:ABC-2 type transport system ATP-binding protein